MWKRSDLKRNAKTALKANYLKCMLAGIILLFAAGSQSFGGSSTSTVQDASDAYYQSLELMNSGTISGFSDTGSFNSAGELTPEGYAAIYQQAQNIAQDPTLRMLRRFVLGPMQVIWDSISDLLGGSGSILMFLLGVLVLSPLEVGGYKFFVENERHKEAQTTLSHFTCAFKDRNYMNVVSNLLCRDIFITLWSLLLVVPGIIKSYEYRMVPYILADHPDMKRKEVFQKSKEMMYGQKWNAFILDWSFFFWDYLSILTFGLAGIFFVYPYKHATNAELYIQLKNEQTWNQEGFRSWEN